MSPAVSPLLGPVCADGSTSVKLRQLRSLDLIKEADMSVGRSVSAYGATISLKDTYGDHLAEAEPEQGSAAGSSAPAPLSEPSMEAAAATPAGGSAVAATDSSAEP